MGKMDDTCTCENRGFLKTLALETPLSFVVSILFLEVGFLKLLVVCIP